MEEYDLPDGEQQVGTTAGMRSREGKGDESEREKARNDESVLGCAHKYITVPNMFAHVWHLCVFRSTPVSGLWRRLPRILSPHLPTTDRYPLEAFENSLRSN